MLARILKLFRPLPSGEVRCFPAIPDLPSLWRARDGDRPRSNLAVLDTASTGQLTRLCDNYWDSLRDDKDLDGPTVRDASVRCRALELLATRGGECLSWARARLKHPDYGAREDAATLIMQLAESNQLGAQAEAVGEELAALALQVPAEDTKEAQAATAALDALSVMGGPACWKAVRGVLNSPEWDQDENQWQAAEMLAEMTGEPFMAATNPIIAARQWLAANPESRP